MRTITEPRIPKVCAVVKAALTVQQGQLPDSAEDHLDTHRLQDAIDHCTPGQAVELAKGGTEDAFLSGPLDLRPTITLLVDADVTLFASRNPRVFDRSPGSCGKVDTLHDGCRPLLEATNAPHGAVMGAGAIDGQGGRMLLHTSTRWWDLAEQARTGGNQEVPRLLVVDHSNDYTLYGITFRNSPNFHVIVHNTDGFTAWGVKIESPKDARNTDGIDPVSSTNVTITHSAIHAGDDNVAIKANSSGPAAHMTIAHSHFYTGHGMSIGSETNGGVSDILVTDLSIDGADNGIRIKSDVSRGGPVTRVQYDGVCIRNTKHPIVIDPFYTKGAQGMLVPDFHGIVLRGVTISGGGGSTIFGLDATHPSSLTLDAVKGDPSQKIEARFAHLDIDSTTNLNLAGQGVTVARMKNKAESLDCGSAAFPPFPVGPMLTPQEAQVTANPEPLPPPKFGTRTSAIVAADGGGDFRTVQDAVDSLTAQGGSITVRPGTYRETVRIAKPHVRLLGDSKNPADVVIVNGESAYTTGSTFKSATVFVTGDDFYAANLTMQNDYSLHVSEKPQGAQALALSVSGDREIFERVRLLGAQDTLYAASRGCKSETGPCQPSRQYFHDCYIEGHVDFIFGDALAVFDHCTIHAIVHPTVMLTAQSKHYPGQASGYVFDHCTITSDPGTGQIYLGRPWRDYAEVIFLNSVLDAKVNPTGWSEWHAGETERLKTATYAEFQSTGPGASPTTREPKAHQLSASEADAFAPNVFLAGNDHWHPAY